MYIKLKPFDVVSETKRVSESSLPDNKHNHINPGSWVQSLPTQFSHSDLSSSPSSTTELVIDRNQTAHFYIGDDDARYTPTTVSFAERSKLLPLATAFVSFHCHKFEILPERQSFYCIGVLSWTIGGQHVATCIR